MPSDKTTANHSITSLKSIVMPTFALNCVQSIMNQEPSQDVNRKIKKKRRRVLILEGRIEFLIQPFRTWTKRFFKFRVFISN